MDITLLKRGKPVKSRDKKMRLSITRKNISCASIIKKCPIQPKYLFQNKRPRQLLLTTPLLPSKGLIAKELQWQDRSMESKNITRID
jgi:hypothetical protein